MYFIYKNVFIFSCCMCYSETAFLHPLAEEGWQRKAKNCPELNSVYNIEIWVLFAKLSLSLPLRLLNIYVKDFNEITNH